MTEAPSCNLVHNVHEYDTPSQILRPVPVSAVDYSKCCMRHATRGSSESCVANDFSEGGAIPILAGYKWAGLALHTMDCADSCSYTDAHYRTERAVVVVARRLLSVGIARGVHRQ
jgi:hypothetical protein